MRERQHCACCRQDKRKPDLEPGGETYLDMSTGEGRDRVTQTAQREHYYTKPHYAANVWVQVRFRLIVEPISVSTKSSLTLVAWLSIIRYLYIGRTVCEIKLEMFILTLFFPSGIGLKSTPFLGT